MALLLKVKLSPEQKEKARAGFDAASVGFNKESVLTIQMFRPFANIHYDGNDHMIFTIGFTR